jgi:protein TonB
MEGTPTDFFAPAASDRAAGEQRHHPAQHRPAVYCRSATYYRRRLPWLLLAVALHALLITLFLLPPRVQAPPAQPVPIQTQIVNEARVVAPPAPPLKPLSLTPPPRQIIVPVPTISIPEAAAISATTQTAPSAAVAAAVTRAPAAPPVPISAPRFDAAYLHNPAPEYPLQARRLRERGTVLLRVEVSAQGGALQVLIERGSGWQLLDAAALRAVKRWRFEPARRGREPVAAWVLVPIEFDLRH